MAQAQVNWTNPTQRTDNTALDLAFTRVSLSFNGGAFNQVADIPAAQANTTISTALLGAPGNYVVRMVWFDTQTPARQSTQVDTPFVVTAAPPVVLAAPKPGTGVTVVVS